MLPAIEANPEPVLEEMMNSYDEVEVVQVIQKLFGDRIGLDSKSLDRKISILESFQE